MLPIQKNFQNADFSTSKNKFEKFSGMNSY